MRPPRFDLTDYPHHVRQSAVPGCRVFASHDAREALLALLRDIAKDEGLAVHAYVVMPDHYHLVVTPTRQGALTNAFRRLHSIYARQYNRWHRRRGAVWQCRYNAGLIAPDRHLLACQRYVELNPVRAGMVRQIESYPYSSYRRNCLGEPDDLVTPHQAYEHLSPDPVERRRRYKAGFDQPLSDVAETIRAATRGGWAVGDSCFLEKAERLTGRRVRPSPRGGRRPGAGRPRKNRS